MQRGRTPTEGTIYVVVSKAAGLLNPVLSCECLSTRTKRSERLRDSCTHTTWHKIQSSSNNSQRVVKKIVISVLKILRVTEWKLGSDRVWRSHWDAGVQRWQFLHTSALRYLRWHLWQPRCQYHTLPRDYRSPRTMSQSPLLSFPQLWLCSFGFPGNSVTLRIGFKMLS